MDYKLESIKKEIMPRMLLHAMSQPLHDPVDPIVQDIQVSFCEVFKQYLVIVFK